MKRVFGYWRWANREALLRRLEMAVECGVLSAHDAVESFCREAWQVNCFFRGHMWRAFDRIYGIGYYRLGLECGLPPEVCSQIGPEMRDIRERLGREPSEEDVRIMLAVLCASVGGRE